MKQLLSLSAAALLSTSLIAGAAFAQTTQAVAPPAEPTPSEPAWMSDDERLLYEQQGTIFGGFFTDETYAELRPHDEFQTTWSGMAAEDQESLRVACADVATNPERYTQNTLGVCIRAGYL